MKFSGPLIERETRRVLVVGPQFGEIISVIAHD